MIKNTIITLCFIALTLNAFAQGKERQERLKALKVAFITEKLEFTADEAQKFWPIYNAIEKKKEALRKEERSIRKGLDFESITDADANKLLNDMLELENKKHDLQSEQVVKLLKVIPAKKIILLKVVEDQFNKRMLEEMKKRREKFQRKN